MTLAKYLLMGKSSESGSYLENIDALKSSDLRASASQYLGGGRYVIVSITPLKK